MVFQKRLNGDFEYGVLGDLAIGDIGTVRNVSFALLFIVGLPCDEVPNRASICN
jgi:hypothetical protein